MTEQKICSLTAENFEAALQDNELVLIEFWAHWCTPCEHMEGIFSELQQTMGDRVRFYRVDADTEVDVSECFNILTLPTILLFHNKKLVERTVGPKSKRVLTDLIEKHCGLDS
ncbi:MAG: thioredoxin domain-containing protein [Clostridia bacterium]